MPDHKADGELVASALSGCQDAFSELIGRYRQAIFGAAFHYLGNFEDARDTAQEAVVRAYICLPQLRDPDRFGSWLYGITKATALNLVRNRRREVLMDNASLAHSTEPLGARSTEQTEHAELVRHALTALTVPTRLALILHHVGGYSQSEIASFLGISTGAIRTRLSRARHQLREELMKTMGTNLKDAANNLSFDDQFLSGVMAAMRAFGPRVYSRMSGLKENWMDEWAQRAQVIMQEGADEMVAWQVSIGKGRYSMFTSGFAALSQIPDQAVDYMARIADALASPQRVSLLLRLVRGSVSLQQLHLESASTPDTLVRDIKLLREVGALEQSNSGELSLTSDGAEALCSLHNIFLCQRLFMQAENTRTEHS